MCVRICVRAYVCVCVCVSVYVCLCARVHFNLIYLCLLFYDWYLTGITTLSDVNICFQ